MATHSSILAHIVRAEENPMDRRAWQATYSPWSHKEWDTTEHACKTKIILWQLLYQSSELKGLSSSSGPKLVTMESRIHANNIPAHCPGHSSLRGQYLHFSLRLGVTRWLCGKKKIHLPVQETWVQSLGQEDPLEKEMATHSSILGWEIPWTEEPGGL